MPEVVESLVEGGKASAAPPLGPALGPLGVNIVEVVDKINEKTKMFGGMQVPVKIIVDSKTKKFNVEVGIPPITSMLKKELNTKTLAKVTESGIELPGDLAFEKIVEIAKAKDSLSGDLKSRVKQVLGTCLSSGVKIDGKNAKDVQKEVDEGKYNSKIKL